MDSLAEKFAAWTPYHYVHNNPINLIDPTGMSAEDSTGKDDWYMNNETKKVTWIDGSKNIKGYTNLGYSSSNQSYGENRTDHLVMDGSTRQITVNGNVIADFSKKGSIQQDGVMVWGMGADPMDSAIGRDRGQGSIEVGDSDVNAFYALMNKVLSYFKDEVIKSNTPKESTLPITPKPEMEIISLYDYDYTVAQPLGPGGSAAGATVQSRHIKDTMVEKSSSSPVLSRQERIRSQKQYEADSINRRIRK
nr:type IV secretion protein Rhs [Myroides odoratus]